MGGLEVAEVRVAEKQAKWREPEILGENEASWAACSARWDLLRALGVWTRKLISAGPPLAP